MLIMNEKGIKTLEGLLHVVHGVIYELPFTDGMKNRNRKSRMYKVKSHKGPNVKFNEHQWVVMVDERSETR